MPNISNISPLEKDHILGLSNELIYIMDLNGYFKYLNPAWEKVLGYSTKEMLSKPILDFIHPDDHQKNDAEIKNLSQGKSTINFENNYIHKDGSLRTISWIASPMEKEKLIIGIGKDITDIKKTEKENKIKNDISKIFLTVADEDMYADILDLILQSFESKFGIFGYINQKGDLVIPSITRDIWDKCQMEGKKIIFPREEWGCSSWATSLKEKEPSYTNKRSKLIPEGHIAIQRHINMPIIHRGIVIGLIQLANKKTDYTDGDLKILQEISNYIAPVLEARLQRDSKEKSHNSALDELHKSEGKYRLLIENSNDAIYLLYDRKFEITNNKFEEMFGYNQEEINNSEFDFIQLVAPESQSYIKERIKRTSIGEHLDSRYEFVAISKNGRKFEVETSVTYINYKEGIANQGIIHDISERKTHEKELIYAKEKAEESDRLKSAFLTNLSHEIRTPMNGILGFIDLLKSPDLEAKDKEKYFNIIEKSSNRLLNTITDVVELSRIETSDPIINLSETNPYQQIQSIYDLYESEIKEKSLDFSININSSKEVNIRTDQEKLYCIIKNLLNNAIKFTKKGSIEIGYSIKDSNIKFYIKDTGIGIPENKQEAIFNSFVQVEQGHSRHYEGSGLGLTIAKEYVKQLGGNIWVDSVENKGSTFYFTIPYLTSTKPNPVNKTGLTNIEGYTILVVEDEDMPFVYLSEILNKTSNKLLFAKNGKEALMMLLKNPNIDLILMDIKMPVMDGLEATEKIRKFNTEVVIIIQTAHALAKYKEEAFNAGCNDFITKPYTKDQILEVMAKNLS